jgi:hypothetical protein
MQARRREMREFVIRASSEMPEDAIAAMQEVLEDISHIGYTSGFPTTATWLRRARNEIEVTASLRDA